MNTKTALLLLCLGTLTPFPGGVQGQTPDPLFFKDATPVTAEMMSRIRHSNDVFRGMAVMTIKGRASRSFWGGAFKLHLKHFAVQNAASWTEYTVSATSNRIHTQIEFDDISSSLVSLKQDVSIGGIGLSAVAETVGFVLGLAADVTSLAGQLPVVGDSPSTRGLASLLRRLEGQVVQTRRAVTEVRTPIALTALGNQTVGISEKEMRVLQAFLPELKQLKYIAGLALRTNKFIGKRLDIIYERGLGVTYTNLPDLRDGDPDAEFIYRLVGKSELFSGELMRHYQRLGTNLFAAHRFTLPQELFEALCGDVLDFDGVQGGFKVRAAKGLSAVKDDEKNPAATLLCTDFRINNGGERISLVKTNDKSIVVSFLPEGNLRIVDDPRQASSFVQSFTLDLNELRVKSSKLGKGFLHNVKLDGEIQASAALAQRRLTPAVRP